VEIDGRDDLRNGDEVRCINTDGFPLTVLCTYILNEYIVGIICFCSKVAFLRFLFSPGKTAKVIFTAYRGFAPERPGAHKG
jgi:hypothetical protein